MLMAFRDLFQISQINGSSDLALYRFELEMAVDIRIEAEDSVRDVSSTGYHYPLQLNA